VCDARREPPVLRQPGVIHDPAVRLDLPAHPPRQPPPDRRILPRRVSDELLQPLLIPIRQPRGHRVEVVVGALVHSLALLSDAAHMLTDAGAIALSLVAIRLAARPAEGAMTYGFKRAEILSAQFNGATLLVARRGIRSGWKLIETWPR
jgi:hypothetical protein